MLTAGPARPTTTLSLRGWRSRDRSTGTGLAQPKAAPPLSVNKMGRMIVPSGSMCGTGFSVSRPARLAVSSPNHSATTPWVTSWMMIDTINAANSMTVYSVM